MIIMFGWRSRASAIGHGTFLCPHCGADRQYSHMRMRRWFTLFFIPVIPLNTLGEFVQCDTCKQNFKMLVLSTPTTATLQNELMWAMREAIVSLVRPRRSPAVESAALAVLTSFSGQPWTSEELDQDLATFDLAYLQPRLANLAGTLNEQGKERFVGSCAQVVATGGVVDADGRAAIEQIAAGLLMTPAHARGIIDQVLEDARS